MAQVEQECNKLRILSIGSNAISAFFSWRLQASQAAEVTLVWRSHFEAVAQHGISFRSDIYGSDRFRPNRVVRTVDEAAANGTGYDYVFVCIKALPDIYNLGEVIRPVVTPSHTCIIMNTTTAIGIESELMEMYPRNMVLSLCSGIDLTQIGPVDFDHTASRTVYVGALKTNPALPEEAQQDMTESLTLTLEAGAVECVSTASIERHQWERLIGMIAFHPVSIILKEPNHAKLMENEQIKFLINEIFEECLRVAEARSATFPYDFKTRSIQTLVTNKESKSTMYQDFLAGRPLETEVYLATPIRLAKEAQIEVPQLRSLYALLKYINGVNQSRGPPPGSAPPQGNGRLVSQQTGQSMMSSSRPYYTRGMTDGALDGGRTMSLVYGPPPTNGYPRNSSAQQQRRAPGQISRQESLEGLEEFATVAMYNDLVPSGDLPPQSHPRNLPSQQTGPDHAYPGNRQTRTIPARASTSQGYYPPQRDIEQQAQRPARHGPFAAMGKKMNNMRISGRGKHRDFEDEDDEEEDYVENVPPKPTIDPDQVDMLAMTRRGRASAYANRADNDRTGSFASSRPKIRQSKSGSQALLNDIPGIHDTVTNSVLFGMGDNRYGTVDSRTLAKSANGRLNSMQSERLNSISSVQHAYPAGPSGMSPRNQGPPSSMNIRGLSHNVGQYRSNTQHSNNVNAALRGQPISQISSRQQLLSPGAGYPAKAMDPSLANGTRSVTGSASASLGSLGNGSNSHSSSSSRDEMPNRIPPK